MEDIDLNKNHHNGSTNRTLWVTWRRIRGSRAPVLAHLEHFLAANIVLERARTAAHAPERTRNRDGDGVRGAGAVPGCAAHTGMPKEHRCSKVSSSTHHDPQGHAGPFAALPGAATPGDGYP